MSPICSQPTTIGGVLVLKVFLGGAIQAWYPLLGALVSCLGPQ